MEHPRYLNFKLFHDSSVGLYLQIEPALSVLTAPTNVAELNGDEDVPVGLLRKYGRKGGPAFVLEHAKEGRIPPAYAYALNNPLKFIDPDGRGPADVDLINCQFKCGVPVDEAYQTCLGDVSSGDKRNRPGARRTKGDCGLVRDKLIRECRSSCRKKHPLDGGTGGCK